MPRYAGRQLLYKNGDKDAARVVRDLGHPFYITNRRSIQMRLDKFLKVSRLIKRRTVANEACDAGRVLINDKPAKASANVKEGDIITIAFGNKEVRVEVLSVQETVRKEEAKELFKYL